MKALSLAASALERLHGTKLRALGLDKENALPDQLPVLTFRDLTSTELEALSEPDESDEANDLDAPLVPVATADTDTSASQNDESDDIIVEGGEEIEADLQPALDEKIAVTDSDGYRLIRGAKL
jgi:hypothetical protein